MAQQESMAKMTEYVDRIPLEARRAIDGLANETRQAITMALYEHGKLRFRDFQSMLALSKPDLAFHLSRLLQAGLITRTQRDFPAEEIHAYYSLSELGQGLLRGIEQAFIPPPPMTTTSRTYVVESSYVGRISTRVRVVEKHPAPKQEARKYTGWVSMQGSRRRWHSHGNEIPLEAYVSASSQAGGS
jgi:DNA-binding HxlR family transcriptional regulator